MTSNDELMLRAVWMYYNDNMTHAEIADKLRTSRVKITRLLQKAREEGLVEINILEPLPIMYELAKELEAAFSLKEAWVALSGDSLEECLDAVGQAGADYLLEVIYPGCNIGFGWSRTVSRMAPYLKTPPKNTSCKVTELAGSMLGQGNPYSISAKVAETFDAPLYPLAVPVVVQSQSARDALLGEASVQAALEHARQSHIAFMGLGDASSSGTMVTTGYLTAGEMRDLRARGAVGDILMRYFDVEGQRVHNPFDEQVIGLDWEDIRKIPHVVVLAAGPHKVDPILGILRSGLCSCLVTDTNTAKALMQRG